MQIIQLKKMTQELCHELYKHWSNDASIYADISEFKPYTYNEAHVSRYFESKNEPSRTVFTIMLDGSPIGELQLKRIDWEKAECTLSIHIQNDTVKGKGYGTQADRLAEKLLLKKWEWLQSMQIPSWKILGVSMC